MSSFGDAVGAICTVSEMVSARFVAYRWRSGRLAVACFRSFYFVVGFVRPQGGRRKHDMIQPQQIGFSSGSAGGAGVGGGVVFCWCDCY